MRPGRISGTDDRPQVVRILNLVTDYGKQRFTALLCNMEQILKLCVFIRGRHGNHALMARMATQKVEFFDADILDENLAFSGECNDFPYAARPVPRRDQQGINPGTRPQCLKHRIAPDNHIVMPRPLRAGGLMLTAH